MVQLKSIYRSIMNTKVNFPKTTLFLGKETISFMAYRLRSMANDKGVNFSKTNFVFTTKKIKVL